MENLSLSDKGKNGLSQLAVFLKTSYFDVREVNLVGISSFPKEMKTLIIWGAKNRFHSNELNMIDKFLKKGGNLLIALNPDLNKNSTPGIRRLLERYGVRINNDLIVDGKSHVSGSNGTVPVLKVFTSHPIVKDFKGTLFFPLASSVETTSSTDHFTPLAFTSSYPDSWAERSVKEILKGRLRFNAGRDKKGPVSPAAVLEKGKTRIVALGNSSFFLQCLYGIWTPFFLLSKYSFLAC